MIVLDFMSTNFESVSKYDTVSQFISKSRKAKCPEVIVVDDKLFSGIASNYLLISIKKDVSAMKVQKISFKAPTLSGKEELKEAAKLMYTARAHILPIIQNSKVSGVLYDYKLLKAIAKEGMVDGMTAADVMTKKISFLKETDKLGKAIELFHKQKIRHLPVVSNKKPVGIVAWSNVVNEMLLKAQKRETGKKVFLVDAVANERIKRDNLPITTFITRDIITVTPETSLKDVANLMAKNKISSVIIEKFDMIKGIVTTRDVLKLFR